MQIEPHLDIRKTLQVFAHAKHTGNVSHTCRYVGICRETFYRWKKTIKFTVYKGLIDRKKCPEHPKNKRCSIY